MIPPRRNILDKERFLEGNRQRWMVVGLAMWVAVLICHSRGWISDPQPYLTAISTIIMTYVLGATGSDLMKAYKIDSTSETYTETRTQKIDAKVDGVLVQQFEDRYHHDPSYRPLDSYREEVR